MDWRWFKVDGTYRMCRTFDERITIKQLEVSLNKKSKWFNSLVVAFILVSVFALAIPAQAQDKPARTYYESLNLSTPEDAVKTFTAAFAKEDFPTVFMILAPKTQQTYLMQFEMFAMDQLVKPDYGKQALKNVPRFVDWESMEYSFLFDTVMLDAAEHDALLIDLGGDVTVGSSKQSTTKYDDPAVDVTTKVDGIEGDVVFRMVQSHSERWRVFQVIVAGGDEEKIPWSVPSTTDS
jgi:hypothetical protein